jgi:hypothetical protein
MDMFVPADHPSKPLSNDILPAAPQTTANNDIKTKANVLLISAITTIP